MPAEGEVAAGDGPAGRPRNRECQRCERPKSVCLCSVLPDTPIKTAGRIIILQHPSEHKKRLATVPVFLKCVADVKVLRSRTYRPDLPQHATLREALEGAAAGRYPLLVLFPGEGALDVREVAATLHGSSSSSSSDDDDADAGAGAGAASPVSLAEARQVAGQQPQPQVERDVRQQQPQRVEQLEQPQQFDQQPSQQQERQPQGQQPQEQQPSQLQQQEQLAREQQQGRRRPLYVLLVIDGTWRQAKEMFKAVRHLVLHPNGPGVRVQLPPPPSPHAPPATPGTAAGAAAAACGVGEQQDVAAAVAPPLLQLESAAAPAAAGAGAAAGAAAAVDGLEDGGPPVLLRVEPMEGCLTTCEALARTLGFLEPAEGFATRDAILRPLAQLARYQAQWDPAVAARLATGSGYSRARGRMGMGRLGGLSQVP